MTQHSRAVDLSEGLAMVVTDLHGEGEIFDHLVNVFLNLHASGAVNNLVLCGDLVHAKNQKNDHSLRMLERVISLQEELGRETVIMLLGNHEMPHVYGSTLMKGDVELTPPFERALTDSGKRKELVEFLTGLPFYVRTQAGVLITHAGATPVVKTADDAEHLLTFDHAALLTLADDKLFNDYDLDILRQSKNYMSEAQHHLAIDGPNDPRLHHLLRGQLLHEVSPDFDFLWGVLFARNEHAFGLRGYDFVAQKFLEAISSISLHEQRVILAGHIKTEGGHMLIGQQHLRLATYSHAHPDEDGEYLLLDCEHPVNSASDLLPHLRPVFASPTD